MSEHGIKPFLAVIFAGALALFGALPAAAGTNAFFDPDGTGNRLWSYTAAWYTCNDYKNDQTKYRSNISVLGSMPTSSQTLMVDSDLLTPAAPLKVDDGLVAVVAQMNMAYYLGSPYGDEPHMVALEVGAGATLCTASSTANFNVGYCENGQALMLVDAGALVSNINFRVGVSGLGIVTNRGGRVEAASGNSGKGLFLGYNASGSGVYSQSSGDLAARCHVGYSGEGRLEVSGGGMKGQTYLGEQSGGKGFAVFSGVVVSNESWVGCAANSCGCLHLRGSTNYASTVKIRDNADAYGQLRGWGSVFAYSSTAICGEMNYFFMNGQAIADGEGVDGRMLDLRLIRTGAGGKYSNVKVTIPNGMAGTNGWYAVNRGVLAYPMIYVQNAEWFGTFGANTNESCDAVNTVRIGYSQSSNKSPWLEALLYANDSSMVPEGLAGRPIGVWGFRSNVKYNDRQSQLANLTGFSLRFRYDHRSLRAGTRLSLMRYDQSAGVWRRIAQAEHDPGSPFISASSLAADGAGYDRNLGIFAVVRDRLGAMVIFR